MITITEATVVGDNGATLADMDRETVQASTMLGGPNVPEGAADYLRSIYREVIDHAGAVTLDVQRASAGQNARVTVREESRRAVRPVVAA